MRTDGRLKTPHGYQMVARTLQKTPYVTYKLCGEELLDRAREYVRAYL